MQLHTLHTSELHTQITIHSADMLDLTKSTIGIYVIHIRLFQCQIPLCYQNDLTFVFFLCFFYCTRRLFSTDIDDDFLIRKHYNTARTDQRKLYNWICIVFIHDSYTPFHRQKRRAPASFAA